MKRIFIISSLLFFCSGQSGCDPPPKPDGEEIIHSKPFSFANSESGEVTSFPEPGIRTIKIDGCEYVIAFYHHRLENNASVSICHKGNCPNPIHEWNR